MREVAEECGMENEGQEETGTLQNWVLASAQQVVGYLINVSQS